MRTLSLVLGLTLGVLALTACAAKPARPPASVSRMELQQASIQGFRMDPPTAAQAEQHLAANPDDLALRAKLLGYYFRHSRDAVVARRAHVIWMITNHPDSAFTASPECGIQPVFDPEGYVAGVQAWETVQKASPDNAQIRIGFANFLMFSDRKRAIALIRQGLAATPDDQVLSEALVSHLRLSDDPDDQRQVFTLQRDLLAKSPANERYYRLGQAAEAAYLAHEFDLACQWAAEWIDITAKEASWNTGNAIHNGHQILGLVALDRGNTPLALSELAAAATSHGSPQLDSFGPDFRLAQALLAKGHRAEVADYLRKVGSFWKNPKLSAWITTLEQGGTPELKR
jgi:hypothetical protein